MECLVYFRSMHLKTAKKKIDKLISHSVFWRKMKCHAENKGIKVMQKKKTKKTYLNSCGRELFKDISVHSKYNGI